MKHLLFGPAALLLFAGFLVFDVWLLLIEPSGSWEDHAGVWLTLVGLLAIAIGFVRDSELRKALPDDLDNITSPWPRKYLAGNWVLVGLSMSFAIALLYGRAPWRTGRLNRLRDTRLWPIEASVLIISPLLKIVAALLMTAFWFAAIAAYLILVVPAAYPAYAAMGFVLFAIRNTNAPPEKRILHPDVDPREVVKDHEVALRAFAVGALGTISGFLLKVIALY